MKVTELLVVSSKEIKNPSQLKELFRDKCAVQIDSIIYTSAESIIYIVEVLRDLADSTSVDNQIATTEFCGLYAMALAVAWPEEFESTMKELIAEEESDLTLEEAAKIMFEELEEHRKTEALEQ